MNVEKINKTFWQTSFSVFNGAPPNTIKKISKKFIVYICLLGAPAFPVCPPDNLDVSRWKYNWSPYFCTLMFEYILSGEG